MREICGKGMPGRLEGMSLGSPKPGVAQIYAPVSSGTMHFAMASKPENQKPSSESAPQIWTNNLLTVNGMVGDDMRGDK